MGVRRIGKAVIERALEKMPASRPLALGGVTFKGVKKVVNSDDISAAARTVSLAAADSGTVFLLDDGAVTTYNLPTPQAGIEYTFILVDQAGSSNNVIKATTNGSTAEDVLTGLLHNHSDDPLIKNAVSTITFVGATATTGDFCKIIGIGTGITDGSESWWAEVHCDADGGVTMTAED